MSFKLALAAYTFCVKNVGSPDEYEPKLGKLGTGIDFFDIFNDYFKERENSPMQDIVYQRYFSCEHLLQQDRGLCGIMQLGDHGIGRKFINVKTKEELFESGKDDAGMIPYYFRVEIPKESHSGIMIFQKAGSGGIRKTIQSDFERWLQARNSPYRLKIYRPARAELLDQYVKPARVQQIQFVRNYKPSDLTDAIDNVNRVTGKIVLTVQAQTGKGFKIYEIFREILNGRREMASLIELEDFEAVRSFDFDDVKLGLVSGKSRHTLGLNNLRNFCPPEDITDFVERDPKTNHPLFKSVDALAAKLAQQVRIGIQQVLSDVQQDQFLQDSTRSPRDT